MEGGPERGNDGNERAAPAGAVAHDATGARARKKAPAGKAGAVKPIPAAKKVAAGKAAVKKAAVKKAATKKAATKKAAVKRKAVAKKAVAKKAVGGTAPAGGAAPGTARAEQVVAEAVSGAASGRQRPPAPPEVAPGGPVIPPQPIAGPRVPVVTADDDEIFPAGIDPAKIAALAVLIVVLLLWRSRRRS